MRDTCLNCGKRIEGEPFDIYYCSEHCKVDYKFCLKIMILEYIRK